MIKVITVVKRKRGIDRPEFYKYWKETHGPLIARNIPNMRRYVQNHFVDVPGMEYEGDGIIEVWYDDVKAMQESLAFNTKPEAKLLGEDWAKIADMGRPRMWVAEEHVIMDNIS